MKVCVLTHTFPRNKSDVSAAFMKEFCDGLVENGNEVSVLTPYDQAFHREGDPFKIYTYKYIWPEKLHLIGYSRTMESDIRIRKIVYLLLPFLLVFAFLSLWRLVKKEKPDIICVHWIIPSGIVALLISKLTNIPYTVTLPGTDAYLAQKNKIVGMIVKLIAKNSSALISNSPWNLNKVVSLGIKDKIAEVITYPVDTKKFHPVKLGLEKIRNQHQIQSQDVVLLAVGRLVYKKGFNYLIEAMPEVVKKFPQVKLLIGGEGDLFETWNNLIKKLNLEKNVFLIGTLPRDQILYYYNLTDIMVTPSIIDPAGNIDGRPLVILESMACGKSQIVSNLPGIADALTNNVNAILVEQKNSNQLTLAIIKLVQNKKLRIKLGENNLKLARDILSTKKVGQRYTDIFNKIVNSK